MSNKDGFNIDDLQSQIHEAENYLQSSMEVRRSLRNSFNFDRIDNEQLHQHREEDTSRSTKSPLEGSDMPGDKTSFLSRDEAASSSKPAGGRYSQPSDREALIERLLSDHQNRKAQRTEILSSGKFTDSLSYQYQPRSDEDEKEGLMEPPLKATIRFGSAGNSPSDAAPSESPSLFRIMQSDQPVDVSAVLFSRKTDNSDTRKSNDSPDSLSNHSDLGATIKFTRSLDPHEKFVDYSAKNTDKPQTTLFQDEDSVDGSVPEIANDDDDEDAIGDSSYNYRYADADSLDSSHEFDGRPRQSRRRVQPATHTPMTQRLTTLSRSPRSKSRSRSPRGPIIRRNTREVLVKQAEEEFRKTHTFTPQLSTTSTFKGKKSKTETTDSTKQGNEAPKYRPSRIQQLHEEYLEKCRERERMKYEFEKIDMMQCTFRPQINRRSQSPSRTILDEYGDAEAYVNKSSSRLHDEAAERYRRRHMLAEQIHEEEMMQYTFEPQVRVNPKYHIEERPIHERLAELQKERQQHMNRLRESYEQERSASFTFQPQIDQRSKTLAEDRAMKDVTNSLVQNGGEVSGVEEAYRVLDRDRDVGKRLMEESIRLKRKKQQLLYEREVELSKQMEPPKISKGSQKIIQSNDDIRADFEKRMDMHQQRVKATKEAMIREEDERHQQWFKPTLEESTVKIITKKRPEILEETPSQRVRRLSVQDQQQIQERKKQLEDAMYGHITYTPHIDPVSRMFGRKSTVQELYENPRGKQAQTWARVKAEREIEEECTFQPKINAKSRKMVEPDDYDYLYQKYESDYPSTEGYEESRKEARSKSMASQQSSRLQRINFDEPERMVVEIRQRALEKEEQRRQALIAQEIAELQECSFQPNIQSRYRPESIDDDPIVIRGLGRHMELRELTAKLKEENRQREFKAFHVVNVDKLRRPEDGTTIVKPFDLSYSQASEKEAYLSDARRRR